MRIEWPDGTSEIIDCVVPTVAEARKLAREGVVNAEELMDEAKAAVAAAAEQKIVDEVFAEAKAGKLDLDDTFDVIDARLLAAGLKKRATCRGARSSPRARLFAASSFSMMSSASRRRLDGPLMARHLSRGASLSVPERCR